MCEVIGKLVTNLQAVQHGSMENSVHLPAVPLGGAREYCSNSSDTEPSWRNEEPQEIPVCTGWGLKSPELTRE